MRSGPTPTDADGTRERSACSSATSTASWRTCAWSPLRWRVVRAARGQSNRAVRGGRVRGGDSELGASPCLYDSLELRAGTPPRGGRVTEVVRTGQRPRDRRDCPSIADSAVADWTAARRGSSQGWWALAPSRLAPAHPSAEEKASDRSLTAPWRPARRSVLQVAGSGEAALARREAGFALTGNSGRLGQRCLGCSLPASDPVYLLRGEAPLSRSPHARRCDRARLDRSAGPCGCRHAACSVRGRLGTSTRAVTSMHL